MNAANTVTYLTLVGKPGSHPPATNTTVESEGQRFVVTRVLELANGSWQANAVPSHLWRHFK